MGPGHRMTTMISSRRLARLGGAALVALLVAGLAAPARSVSDEEVERAREAQQAAAAARAAALGDLEEAAAVYEALNGEYQALVFSMGQMRSRIDAYQAQARETRDEGRP